MKNTHRTGRHTAPRSARSKGNVPAPYTRFKKAPYNYKPMYKRIVEREAGTTFARHLKLRGAV